MHRCTDAQMHRCNALTPGHVDTQTQTHRPIDPHMQRPTDTQTQRHRRTDRHADLQTQARRHADTLTLRR
eukprot:7453036-Alexandrium_andersonii.AAC.1